MVTPLLLLICYSFLGQPRRAEQLKSYFKGDLKAYDYIVTGDKLSESDLLYKFIIDKFREAHSYKKYLLPLVLFYLPYIFGLYLSFISFDFILRDSNSSAIWESVNTNLYNQISIACAGFMGAVFVVLTQLFWRSMTLDMQPKAFLNCTSRLLLVPFIAVVLANSIPGFESNPLKPELFIAFGTGLFYQSALRTIEKIWNKAVGQLTKNDFSLDLKLIHGIDNHDEFRLREEGINNAENLAVESVENLLINTNYSAERIVDWKDQAFLLIYVENEISEWRKMHVRGIMDVLGMAPEYFGENESKALIKAISTTLKKEEYVIERFINTVYNDPRPHRLWNFLKAATPTKIAEQLPGIKKKLTSEKSGASNPS